MTEKRFTIEKGNGLYRIFDNGELFPVLDGQPICDLLNELNDEKEQLKKILNELSDMLQFDVENGIRSYPVKLSEYLSNALKELGND